MTDFYCKIGTPGGRVTEKVYQAENEKALRQQLEGKDYHVFSIRKKGLFSLASLDLSRLGMSRRKIKVKDFLIFNQEFMALIKAGMPILHSLALLSERIKDPFFKRTLQNIRDDVEGGAALHEAFESQDCFSRVYTASLMAGERSGDLVGVLKRFVEYLKILINIRRKVVSALVYPILLVILSIALITVMIVLVIPRFEQFYADFDAELPAITQFLLSFSLFIKNNILLIVVLLVVGVIALRYYGKTPAGGIKVDGWTMRIPLLGSIWRRYSISQMTRTLATVLSGGIPLVISLDVAAKAIGNRLISREVKRAVQRVNEGQSLADSLGRTGFFTDLTIEMVKVGESSGALTEMLNNVSDFYDEEVDSRVSTLISMLEPVLLISMGLVIAGMLLAMYMPLFSAMNAVKG